MDSKSLDFILEYEDDLGAELHWLRAENLEPISICAKKLGVPVEIIDKLESGQLEDPRINLELLIRFAALYKHKFHLSFRGDYDC